MLCNFGQQLTLTAAWVFSRFKLISFFRLSTKEISPSTCVPEKSTVCKLKLKWLALNCPLTSCQHRRGSALRKSKALKPSQGGQRWFSGSHGSPKLKKTRIRLLGKEAISHPPSVGANCTGRLQLYRLQLKTWRIATRLTWQINNFLWTFHSLLQGRVGQSGLIVMATRKRQDDNNGPVVEKINHKFCSLYKSSVPSPFGLWSRYWQHILAHTKRYPWADSPQARSKNLLAVGNPLTDATKVNLVKHWAHDMNPLPLWKGRRMAGTQWYTKRRLRPLKSKFSSAYKVFSSSVTDFFSASPQNGLNYRLKTAASARLRSLCAETFPLPGSPNTKLLPFAMRYFTWIVLKAARCSVLDFEGLNTVCWLYHKHILNHNCLQVWRCIAAWPRSHGSASSSSSSSFIGS